MSDIKWMTIIWLNQTASDLKKRWNTEKAFRAEVAKAKCQLVAGLKELDASWLDRVMFKFILGLDADQKRFTPKQLVIIRLRVFGKDIAKVKPKAIYHARRKALKAK